jgi:hypothetical protein
MHYNSSNSYRGYFDWRTLQLGNNGTNNILFGNTAAGGQGHFYVNATGISQSGGTSGIHAFSMLASGEVVKEANERFTIKSHSNAWAGGLRMISQDGTDTFQIHPDNNGWMYVDKIWNFNGDIKMGGTTVLDTSRNLTIADASATNFHANDTVFWYTNSSDRSHQRADARSDGSSNTFSRLHWYGVSHAQATSNFRHAWYDGSDYINVTAASGTVTFGGAITADNITGHDFKPVAGYHLQRSDHHSGHLEGSYNNVGGNGGKSNPIYTIGSSYNPVDAGLSNMYGIGYTTYTTALTGTIPGGNDWGMYVAAGGVGRVWLDGANGNIGSVGGVYATNGYHVGTTAVIDSSRNATFVKQTINGTIAPNAFAWLNIGSTGSGETRAIDIDGAWSAGESKAISFTHGSVLTELVGQIKSTFNNPSSSLSFGRLYHSGNSSVYPLVLTSTSTTAADLNLIGNFQISGNIVGNSNNTTEVGTYATGAIKRVRMSQGGEIHFGDTTSASPLGITEGAWDNFADQDRLSVYYRSNIKFFSGVAEKASIDGSGNFNAAGNVTTPAVYLTNSGTKLSQSTGSALRITTPTGYMDIGSMNSGWIHFQGSLPYYFNQPMHIDNHLYPYSTAGARNIGGTGNVWNHVYAKGYFIDSTEVIDASRNITGQEVAASTRLYLNGGNYEGQIVFGTTDAWRCGIRQHDDGDAELRIWAKNANGRVHIATGYDGQPTSITKPTDGFVVDHNNVGIGAFSAIDPSEKLHVLGNILTSGGTMRASHSKGHQIGSYNNIAANSDKTNPIYTIGSNYNPTDTSVAGMYGIGYAHENLWGSGKSTGWGMYVVSGGTYNATISLSGIWSVGNITAYSDRRVKTNIERIPNALEKVCKLNGYTFDRTDGGNDIDGKPLPVLRQTGVIAQEVLEILPEAVTGSEEDHYSVAYGNMVGLLIEAIKEQKKEVNELKLLVKQLLEK